MNVRIRLQAHRPSSRAVALFLRSIAVLVLCVGSGFHPLLASTVIVPDHFPNVQPAIDSGADTVLIREGTYPERPVVNRPLVMQGIGLGQRPRLDGLDIFNLNFFSEPRLLSVSRVDFSGRVDHTINAVHPRNLLFSFSECSLDSGFFQVFSLDPDDVLSLTFRNCRLGGYSKARAWEVSMEADTVDGGVAWSIHEASILHCWFKGGPGSAIELTDTPRYGTTAHNRIEDYETGISVDDGDPYTIEDNTVLRCDTGIKLTSGSDLLVRGNEIRECGVGVHAVGVDGFRLLKNTILDATGPGVMTETVGGLVAEDNVVGKCGGPGVVLDHPLIGHWIDPLAALLRGNTIFRNGDSGMVMPRTLGYPIGVENNICATNGGWGLSVPAGQPVELSCNDWFGNGLGSVDGVSAHSSDLTVDPMFCNADSADVRLQSASPLLDVPGCGRIGALDVGCGLTATLIEMLTVEPNGCGVVVRWRFGSIDPVFSWLERATEEAGPWHQAGGTPHLENEAFAQCDADVHPGSTYWYRVGWSVANEVGYSVPIRFTVERTSSVSNVFPNPSLGPVTIEWTLGAAADMDVRVFDLAGREVAAPARGRFEAGKHSIRWEGLRSTGEPAATGWYVVRLRGGADDAAHMLLLLR